MSKGNEPAYPVKGAKPIVKGEGDWDTPRPVDFSGLTKRELFAAMAMQNLVVHFSPASVATMAVEHADALLAELERTA